MISVAEAQAKIAELLHTTETERIGLSHAGGRVLAVNAVAQRDQPPFAASAMDGYAVRAADLTDGARLRVVGQVAAGQSPDRDVGPQEAVRIFTGAPVPNKTYIPENLYQTIHVRAYRRSCMKQCNVKDRTSLNSQHFF